MENRSECSYGDKCYRKNPEHFENFKHLHLDELLEKIGTHEVHVPFGHIPNVSFSTLKIQLEIERKLRANQITEVTEPEVKRARTSGSPRQYSGKKTHGSPNKSQSSEKSLTSTEHSSKVAKTINMLFGDEESKSGSSSEMNEGRNISSSPIRGGSPNISEQAIITAEHASKTEKVMSQLFGDVKSEPGTSHDMLSQNGGPSKKSFEKQKVSAARHNANMRDAERFRDEVRAQLNMSIGDKLRLAAPYNILYTSLPTGPDYAPDRLSVTFPELLDSPLGLLLESLQINFMVQFGWLLACYFTMGHSHKPMTLLYGDTDTEFGTKFKFLKAAKVKPPSAFGSHHTKMMIFRYLDKSIRVVICTANLVESDWTNKTQGVWISDKCEEMMPSESGGESRTNFKKDLLEYLQSYKISVLDPWIEMVKKADMSHINVFFIASIPGAHKVSEGKWGQARLRSVLKKHAPVIENNSYRVITQISSIGSLGPNPDSWLMNDILTTFTCTKSPTSLSTRPSLSVVYPSFIDVMTSADGLIGGGCLPYSCSTHTKQLWLNNYFCHWKSDNIQRTKAVPHIKSYTRVSHDNTKISYFLLTSANLSKAAWGTISKTQNINILSYEAGVLLLPEFVLGDVECFPLVEDMNETDDNKPPAFSLPYDVPLLPYNSSDSPWFMDNLTAFDR